MGTYLNAHITGPLVDLEKVKLKKLPTWELNDVIGWDLDEITRQQAAAVDPETGLFHGWSTIKTGEWWITLEGNSKWANEEAYGWAERFTTKHPALTLTIREEWDNRDADEAGIEQRVYWRGSLLLTQSRMNGEVPMNLSTLLDDARRAITAYHMPIGDEQRVTEGLVNALQALVTGLE